MFLTKGQLSQLKNHNLPQFDRFNEGGPSHRRGASTQLSNTHQPSPNKGFHSVGAKGFEREIMDSILRSATYSQYKSPLQVGAHSTLYHKNQHLQLPTGRGAANLADKIGAKPTLLPNIVQQGQTPMMKPFKTLTSKTIKRLKKGTGGAPSPVTSAYFCKYDTQQQQLGRGTWREIEKIGSGLALSDLESTNGGEEAIGSHFRRVNKMQTIQEEFLNASLNTSTMSKSVQPQFRLGSQEGTGPIMKKASHLRQEELEENGISPQTPATIKAAVQSGSLQARYSHTPLNQNGYQIPNQIDRQSMILLIREFEGTGGAMSPSQQQLKGTNCLNPVSENEERTIKAQQALKRLKLDIDMNRENENQSRDEAKGINQQTRTKFVLSADSGNFDGTERGSMIAKNTLSFKDRLLGLADIHQEVTLSSEATLPPTLVNGAKRFREVKLPDTTPITQASSPTGKSTLYSSALPHRSTPLQVIQTHKMQQALVNFSKYKQLKRFNDSLVRIQQKMIRDMKDQQQRARLQSKATEYNDGDATSSNQNEREMKVMSQLSAEQIAESDGEDEQLLKLEQRGQVPGQPVFNKRGSGSKSQLDITQNSAHFRASTLDYQPLEKTVNRNQFLNNQQFTYGHHSLVPRKTFFATKKEIRSDYQKVMKQGEGFNDMSLKINQANLKERYMLNTIDLLGKNQDIQNMNVSQQMTSSMPSKNEDSLKESLRGQGRSSSPDQTLLLVNAMQKDIQDGFAAKQSPLRNGNVETLNRLRDPSMIKSNISGNSSLLLQASQRARPSQQEPILSQSSNRIVIVHKQHSVPASSIQSPKNEKVNIHFKNDNSVTHRQQHIKSNHQKARQQQILNPNHNQHHRSKSVLIVNQNPGGPNPTSPFLNSDHRRTPSLFKKPIPLSVASQIDESFSPAAETSIQRKMPDFPGVPDSIPLQVSMNIFKDLVYLREQKKFANLMRAQAKLEQALREKGDASKFFHTEVHIPRSVHSPIREWNEETTPPLTKKLTDRLELPDLFGANKFKPQQTSDQDFSLNFPMRNSRLSEAVIASLSMEDRSQLMQLSQKLTQQESIVHEDKSGVQSTVRDINQAPIFASGLIKISPTQNSGAITPSYPIKPPQIESTLSTAEQKKALKDADPLTPLSQTLESSSHLKKAASPRDPALTAPPETIFQEKKSAMDFMKSYFTKELPFDKDQELKKRMRIIRKAVAILEREHFSSQQTLMTANVNNPGKDGFHSAR